MDSYPRILMSEVKELYRPGPQRHWFDPETMRFFKCKLPGVAVQTPHGNYFVTCETNPSFKTAYTVRRQDPKTGDIETVGRFHALASYVEARKAMWDHIRQQEEMNV